MHADPFFIRRAPRDPLLSPLVDYYFYIDVELKELPVEQEFMIPFPRITFGYFFEHPFLVNNHSRKESVSRNMAVSRISSQKVSVQPQTDRIKIIGAHLYPLALAYLSAEPVKNMPWLINPPALLKESPQDFRRRFDDCTAADELFGELEKLFLAKRKARDLSLMTKAIACIDESAGDVKIKALAEEMGVSARTMRTQFNKFIGCSPKEYARLVKIKQVAWQLQNGRSSLTHIAYDNSYFDQAHFIHELKSLTGKAPQELKKEIPHFRFLQF